MSCRLVVVHNSLLVTTVDKVEVSFLRHCFAIPDYFRMER
jgi:hypothetical protein